MAPLLDREGLHYLTALHSKVTLARIFGVTLPTLRRYLAGNEPKNINITRGMNTVIASMKERNIKRVYKVNDPGTD